MSEGDKPDTVKVADENGNLVPKKNGQHLEIDFEPPGLMAGPEATAGGERTITTDEDGKVTEKVVVDLVRPVP